MKASFCLILTCCIFIFIIHLHFFFLKNCVMINKSDGHRLGFLYTIQIMILSIIRSLWEHRVLQLPITDGPTAPLVPHHALVPYQGFQTPTLPAMMTILCTLLILIARINSYLTKLVSFNENTFQLHTQKFSDTLFTPWMKQSNVWNVYLRSNTLLWFVIFNIQFPSAPK